MNEVDDFGKPDREGFDALLREPFVLYQSMIFRKGAFDKAAVELNLESKSPKEVQRELNHTHLFLYAVDIKLQRQWSNELESNWRDKIRNQFPNFAIHIDQEDNGLEVIATFWVS